MVSSAEELQEAFRKLWLPRITQAMPFPSALLGGIVVYHAPEPLLALVCIVACVLLNVVLSALEVRELVRSGVFRLVLNVALNGLIGWVGGPSGAGLVFTILAMFASVFTSTRVPLYRGTLLGSILAAMLGAWLAGTPLAGLVSGGICLGVIGFFVERLFHPLRQSHIAVQQREQELENSLRFRQMFLATMSHEIRTPLNGILGIAELLKDTPLDAQQREMIDTALNAGRSLTQILNDTLDLSKLEAGALHLEEQPYVPERVLSEVVALLQHMAAEKPLSLTAASVALPPQVIGDVTRLRQVLINLLSNALKFTAEGEVRVELRWSAGRLWGSVSDTGIGIPADDIERLFTPFQQADASTSRQFGGTGLGLSISRHLVSMMGGTLTAQSTLGQGSVFTFSVTAPLAEPAAPKAEAGPTWAGRVLVVDDNPLNLRMAQAMLARLGCPVISVSSGVLALKVPETEFDLVLMDCQMPGMDGFETTTLMRARGLKAPILALTAGVTAEERARCLSVGMDAVLGKPITPEMLAEALSDWGPRARLSG